MSGPGDASPTEVTAERLVALGSLAARLGRDRPEIARRPGTTATRPRGQGHEIREIRPFAEGDDPRHLDAAATARTGSPQVRGFHEDRDRALMLIADFRRPMLWGTRRLRSVALAEALALAGWRAVLDGGAVGVAVITDDGVLSERPTARARGMAKVAGCLARGHALALTLTGHPVRPLAPDLVRAGRLAPRGARVLLGSALDLPGPGLPAALDGIRRRGPLRVLLPLDPFEAAPPGGELPYLAGRGAALGAFGRLPAARAAELRRLADMGIAAEEVPTDRVAGVAA
ncbi:DUF58 domain-containing protein [Amaricoccus solimangrovi]|uniref:DUF58 domain-containing protein n=1 Tax=Amaricoccus solimangrovi TaxID=2589815 RepID=A0A501WN02_9RHOB|nr:DUF58 domain-containing protein [Amaricoccus solimangrovi]TPE50232.1 DUF58 domain-containing protein [Amaricoccus solimangrovi]